MKNKQREIKFRAWDKLRNIMLDPFTLWELHDDGQDFERNSCSMFVNRKWNLFDNEDYIFMQYAGLKDKNGKEIYEGDILDCQWNIDNNMRGGDKVLSVVWDMREFYYDCNEGMVDLGGSWVIGNIYENPELLEETDEK